eukprot:11208053-Lingulodinium_polyedra.AAC.1
MPSTRRWDGAQLRLAAGATRAALRAPRGCPNVQPWPRRHTRQKCPYRGGRSRRPNARGIPAQHPRPPRRRRHPRR